MIVHRRWTIIKKQHPSKTCRFHGMQFFNGPVGTRTTLSVNAFDFIDLRTMVPCIKCRQKMDPMLD